MFEEAIHNVQEAWAWAWLEAAARDQKETLQATTSSYIYKSTSYAPAVEFI